MTAPILPLDADNLPSFRNVAIVGAWMLFPDDAAWREKMISNAEVLEGLDRLAVGKLQQSEIDPLVRKALKACSTEDIYAQFQVRGQRGAGAGVILYNTCMKIPKGDAKPMDAVKRDVECAIWKREKGNSSHHVDEAVWKKYRCVASLWAAYLFLDDGEDHPNGVEFPCETHKLKKLLSRAEGFRDLAERSSPPRRKGRTVLLPGESLTLPPEVLIQLEPGHFVTDPV